MIAAINNEFKTFALAIHFLTRIPTSIDVDFTAERLSNAARYYPLVGAIVGIVAALAFFVANLILPTLIAVVIATAATALLTGGFHEDGLADTFDGIGGAHTRERALEIMHDSRIGTFGALALIIVIALKIASLAAMPEPQTIVVALVAAHIISRTSIVIVQTTSIYAREDGIAGSKDQSPKPVNSVLASLIAVITIIAVAVLLSPISAFLTTIGAVIGHLLIRLYFQPKLKGHTGDTLGATQQITEVAIYIALAASI